MAHFMKSTRGGCGNLVDHCERKLKENGEHRKYGNQDIDLNRTHLNYNLGPERGIGQRDFIKQRCSEVKCLNRDDVNVMCSWVITAPRGSAVSGESKGQGNGELGSGKSYSKPDRPILNEQETKLFFEESYKFLNQRYSHGSDKNVISAYVHLDETTPHMHYAFVPVVVDRKKGHEKVSAFEAVTRHDLQTFHKDLEQHMKSVFGREIGILNEATKDGNKTVEELKRGTAAEKLAELSRDIDQKTSALSSAQKEVDSLQAEVDALQTTLKELNTKVEAVQSEITKLETVKSQTAIEASELKNTALKFKDEVNDLEDKQNALEGQIRALKDELEPLQQLKVSVDKIDLSQKGKFPFVTLKNSDFQIISKQAKAYRVNRNEVAEVRQRKNEVEQRESRADERELEVSRMEAAAEKLYQRQLNINEILETTEAQLDTSREHLSYVSDLNASLKHENDILRDEKENLKETYTRHLNALKTSNLTLYEVLRNTVQALGMLKYDNDSGYSIAGLTPKQSKLIDAIADYAASWARQNGFMNIAKEIDETIKICKGIQDFINPPAPKIDRGYGGPGL